MLPERYARIRTGLRPCRYRTCRRITARMLVHVPDVQSPGLGRRGYCTLYGAAGADRTYYADGIARTPRLREWLTATTG